MKIFKVSNLTRWGHEEDEKYYLSPITAEKEFHKRLKKGITSEDLPTRDSMDGSPSWKVILPDKNPFSNIKIKLLATIHYWDSYETDCGTEADINSYDIIFQEIDIQDGVK